MPRWTIVGTGHEIGFTSLSVYASTSVADHLFMSWAYHKPIQREIWRIVRGKRVFCGHKYIWDTPNIEEQDEWGDTLVHRFHLLGLPTGTDIWYYLHSPQLPSIYECQGPLMHVILLQVPTWSYRMFCATRFKGMFRTKNFSGPGGGHPTWVTDNDGLPDPDIRQACPDPFDPYHRRFVVGLSHVYRMDNLFLDEPSLATRVLSQAQAIALTGSPGGLILWIAGNANHQGHFYALFRADVGSTGIWCLKTTDYGESWTAHNIDATIWSFNAGNIMAGDLQGESPYPAGDVLYASLDVGVGGNLVVARSLDEGETWAHAPAEPVGDGLYEPRLHVDPADQGIVYVSGGTGGVDLWRSVNHGATWSLIDDGNHLRIVISPGANIGTMVTRRIDSDEIRVLSDLHLWKSSDFGIIWRDQAQCQYPTRLLHVGQDSYDYLYLGRTVNAANDPTLFRAHVIFVSIDEGSNMFGKSGAHAFQDDGGGDSIPWNCGGVAQQGILSLP